MSAFDQLVLIGLTALAMLLGAVVGLERELARRPAGLRTLMLVAGAAALLVQLGDVLVASYVAAAMPAPDIPAELIRTDPIRIVEAIIAGTSFLGAGTIFRARREHEVQGLTTAASLLFVAAIGISVALRQFVIAFGATALALIALRLFHQLEQRLPRA